MTLTYCILQILIRPFFYQFSELEKACSSSSFCPAKPKSSSSNFLKLCTIPSVYANPTACIGLEGQVLALTAIGLEAITEIEVFFA